MPPSSLLDTTADLGVLPLEVLQQRLRTLDTEYHRTSKEIRRRCGAHQQSAAPRELSQPGDTGVSTEASEKSKANGLTAAQIRSFVSSICSPVPFPSAALNESLENAIVWPRERPAIFATPKRGSGTIDFSKRPLSTPLVTASVSTPVSMDASDGKKSSDELMQELLALRRFRETR
jgi:hypothetical protein